VQRVARGEYAHGIDYLKAFMSEAQRRQLNDPRTARLAIGHTVHDATEAALEKLYPGRFGYSRSSGVDFVDRTTGEQVELTTRGQQAFKQMKHNLGPSQIATYP
jgi:hypothetical protein